MRFSPAFSGGLIEADGARGLTGGGVAFSPAFSGGLIEAPLMAASKGGVPRFSPAFSGGLIEASAPTWANRLGLAVFPRVQRGPH